MPERIERIERIERRLAELRALLERVEQKHLEADDWEMVDALLAEVIEQA
jgi:t-SNARE complex subunit (syntaxin)